MISRRYRCAWGAHEHSSEAGEWTILPRHHVGDIGKQLTMERQQLFTLEATIEIDDALATLKSSQNFGER